MKFVWNDALDQDPVLETLYDVMTQNHADVRFRFTTQPGMADVNYQPADGQCPLHVILDKKSNNRELATDACIGLVGETGRDMVVEVGRNHTVINVADVTMPTNNPEKRHNRIHNQVRRIT